MAAVPPTDSLLAGVDWPVIAYAACMAALASIFSTWRARNMQAEAGLPVSSWWTLIPDTGLGMIVGTLAALMVPELFKPLKTFAGVLILAGVGGVLGPKLTDLLSTKGIGILLAYVGSGAGKLSKAIAAGGKEAKDDGEDSKPT